MRYFLFSIGQKYKLRCEYLKPKGFIKLRYFFFYYGHEKNQHEKRQVHDLVILGLLLRLSRPYIYKFSYNKMPEIKGRRKVQ